MVGELGQPDGAPDQKREQIAGLFQNDQGKRPGATQAMLPHEHALGDVAHLRRQHHVQHARRENQSYGIAEGEPGGRRRENPQALCGDQSQGNYHGQAGEEPTRPRAVRTTKERAIDRLERAPTRDVVLRGDGEDQGLPGIAARRCVALSGVGEVGEEGALIRVQVGGRGRDRFVLDGQPCRLGGVVSSQARAAPARWSRSARS